MIRIQRISGIILAIIAAGSLLLPYVIRSNFQSVNPLIPAVDEQVTYMGWTLASPRIAVILLLGCAALLFSKHRTSIVVSFCLLSSIA